MVFTTLISSYIYINNIIYTIEHYKYIEKQKKHIKTIREITNKIILDLEINKIKDPMSKHLISHLKNKSINKILDIKLNLVERNYMEENNTMSEYFITELCNIYENTMNNIDLIEDFIKGKDTLD